MVGTLRSNINVYYDILFCHDNLYFHKASSKYRNYILSTKIMEIFPLAWNNMSREERKLDFTV